MSSLFFGGMFAVTGSGMDALFRPHTDAAAKFGRLFLLWLWRRDL